jgi:hypothetical protein
MAWHDLTETLLVRVHRVEGLDDSIIFTAGDDWQLFFIFFFTGAKLAYDGIPVDMHTGHEPQEINYYGFSETKHRKKQDVGSKTRPCSAY